MSKARQILAFSIMLLIAITLFVMIAMGYKAPLYILGAVAVAVLAFALWEISKDFK